MHTTLKRVWTTRANQLHQIHKADLNSDSSCTMRSNAYYRRGSEPLEQTSCTKFTKWPEQWFQLHYAVKCILQERVWTTRANQLHQIHKADLNSDSSCTMRSNAYYRRGSEPLVANQLLPNSQRSLIPREQCSKFQYLNTMRSNAYYRRGSEPLE